MAGQGGPILFLRILLPCSRFRIPCSGTQGIELRVPIASTLFGTSGAAGSQVLRDSLYFSLLSGNSARRSVRDTLRRQPGNDLPLQGKLDLAYLSAQSFPKREETL
jgi:hypothetical protein